MSFFIRVEVRSLSLEQPQFMHVNILIGCLSNATGMEVSLIDSYAEDGIIVRGE